MVQKPASYNRDPASDAFADDDPLAELARLVGYDAPRSQRQEPPRVEPEMSSPSANPAAGSYAAPRQPVERYDEPSQLRGGYADDRHSLSAYEPVSFGAGPSRAAPLDQGIGSESDLADELLWSMGEAAVEPQPPRSGGADATEGYNRFRLPLANFNPVHTPSIHRDEPPMQRPEPEIEPERQPEFAPEPEPWAAAAEPEPWAVAPEPEPYRPAAPSERHREPDFDRGFSPEQPAPDLPFSVEPERRAVPAAFQEPVFEAPAAPRREAPSFFDEPSYPVDEPVAAHAPSSEPQKVAAAAVEDDFFAGDLELDLAEIELDLADVEPEPVVARAAPQPVITQAPVQRAPEPVYQAPAPVAASVPEPVYQAPAEPSVPPLPFDASAISDQDEHLEVIANLDVPDLPPPEEDKPVSYATDYDFDIDAELASLLDKTAEQQQPAHQPAPVAHQAPAAAAAHAVPPQASQAKNSLSDDFDMFEKALEEDFRRTLDTQYSFGAKKADAAPEMQEEDDYEDEEPSSSRRWIAIAAAAAVVLVAGGGVFAWMKSDGGEILGGGEPKIVMADKDPVKVVPANPGGKSVPNQNKAVYDRVSGTSTDQPAQKSLISQDEEPMDVAQRTLGPDNLPLDDEAGTANAEAGAKPATGDNENLSPRRVKTMIVRPDGTLVAQDDLENAGSQTANAAPATTQAPSASSSTGQTVGDLLASGDNLSQTPAVEAEEPTGVPAPNMPVPLARPNYTASAQTASAETASAKPAAQQASAATTPAASTATAPGEYLIQISSLPTEADAQKSYKNLSSKYSSVIGGRGMNIKAAEIAGKGTYYRVRIPAGSKEAAVSLCERYRAAGGSCMVVR